MEKTKKTKILAVGDIHGDTGLVERLAEKAKKENVDIIILAGDLTMAEQSIEYLIGPFVKEKKQVLLIPGNHESDSTIEFLAQAYQVKNLHGYGFRKNNLGIFGAGTANMGIHQIGDENIFRLLEKGNKEIGNAKKKIMVTHIHPKGSKTEEIFGFQGSKAVRKAIEEFAPDIAINAHMHEAGGMEEKIGKTWVINVSRKEKIFEI
ncbi:MAG: metallophosphoesterase [Nanoarchaeota archaeon]